MDVRAPSIAHIIHTLTFVIVTIIMVYIIQQSLTSRLEFSVSIVKSVEDVIAALRCPRNSMKRYL